ncbi:MAG: hypothetical protein EOO05_06360 [Chitinophagaceae bacterium]|nr:MAG: hypothetical protein EOO05_06360 [Chitinophagaceae bacterium]
MKLLVLTFVLLSFCPVGGQERYAVIIQEIMADPSPAVGLPSSEWIEIRNRSKETVNLQGWRIADRSSQSGPLPTYHLQPDSILVVCASGSLNSLLPFGPTIAVTSFPSLDNDGDLLSLFTASGSTMHAVDYDLTWYANDLKKEGGWSLELIDQDNPCTGKNNWMASRFAAGGTPGDVNSVNGTMPDDEPPVLLRAYTINDRAVRLVFDETVDSLKASLVTSYNNSDVRPGEAFPIAPMFNEVELRLPAAMQAGLTYTVAMDAPCDCAGNAAAESRVMVGVPALLTKGTLVINEILFNPVPSGYDYVELINAGDSVVDLARGFLASRNSTGSVAGHVALSATPRLLFPGEFFVLTDDPNRLQLHFFSPARGQIETVASMPSFPDDKGVVLVTGMQGDILDEVPYSDKWHFPLMRQTEGVSLERIDPLNTSGDKLNWHSASSTSGYGTPGYRNSQSVPESSAGGLMAVDPPVFSPDNNGIDDQCFIRFSLPQAGMVARVDIFNVHGLLVKRLVQGGLLGSAGYWTWDGLNDKGQAIAPGPYIILVSLFDLGGHSRKYKMVVILASG